jgi:hypothetical protein
LIFIVLFTIGYVRCVVKFINCDFKEPYKAEIIYGVGTASGLGAIIGWINIEDNPKINK